MKVVAAVVSEGKAAAATEGRAEAEGSSATWPRKGSYR